MADISGFEPTGLLVVIGFIVLCLILVFVFSKLERGLKKNLPRTKQTTNSPEMTPEASSETDNTTAFIVGQVYQMEDGTLAKYAGNGKFNKIKPE